MQLQVVLSYCVVVGGIFWCCSGHDPTIMILVFLEGSALSNFVIDFNHRT